MVNQIRSNQPLQNFAPDQTVQTGPQEGEWMLLQNAAEQTGLSEKTIRRYIKNKKLKFRRLGKQTNSPLQVWITPEILQTVDSDETVLVDAVDAEVPDAGTEDFEPAEAPASNTEQRPNTAAVIEIENLVRAMTQQFAAKLDEQKELIYELKNEIQEKEIQLRLLPDLQKQMEENEKSAEFEQVALAKQIEMLKEENEKLKLTLEQKQQLEQQLEQKKSKAWWKWFMGMG